MKRKGRHGIFRKEFAENDMQNVRNKELPQLWNIYKNLGNDKGNGAGLHCFVTVREL